MASFGDEKGPAARESSEPDLWRFGFLYDALGFLFECAPEREHRYHETNCDIPGWIANKPRIATTNPVMKSIHCFHCLFMLMESPLCYGVRVTFKLTQCPTLDSRSTDPWTWRLSSMTLLKPKMKARYTLADGRVIELAIATDPQPDDDESSTPPDPARHQEPSN